MTNHDSDPIDNELKPEDIETLMPWSFQGTFRSNTKSGDLVFTGDVLVGTDTGRVVGHTNDVNGRAFIVGQKQPATDELPERVCFTKVYERTPITESPIEFEYQKGQNGWEGSYEVFEVIDGGWKKLSGRATLRDIASFDVPPATNREFNDVYRDASSYVARRRGQIDARMGRVPASDQ